MTTTPDELINFFIEKETPVVVFLVNGVKLQGYLTGRDEIGLTLERGAVAQVIYHGAVSTIMPQVPVETKTHILFVAASGDPI